MVSVRGDAIDGADNVGIRGDVDIENRERDIGRSRGIQRAIAASETDLDRACALRVEVGGEHQRIFRGRQATSERLIIDGSLRTRGRINRPDIGLLRGDLDRDVIHGIPIQIVRINQVAGRPRCGIPVQHQRTRRGGLEDGQEDCGNYAEAAGTNTHL